MNLPIKIPLNKEFKEYRRQCIIMTYYNIVGIAIVLS